MTISSVQRRLIRPASRAWALRALLALMAAVPGAHQAAGQTTEPVSAPRSTAHDRAAEEAREHVREWVVENNLAGASVAVGLDGEVVWAEGFGWADLEQSVPVTSATRFRIGSVSKSLTAAAIGLLHEQDLLDLDAPVQDYVPSFPEKRWTISTRQLMGHVAGIRHYRDDEEELFSNVHYDNVLESLEVFASDSLLFRPGTDFSYSSYGWNLVGAVVESAAGEPFLELMVRDVFAPLGMQHTVPDDVFEIVPHRTSFYAQDADGRLRNERFVDQSNKWASGGFLSTPSDLVRFGFGMMDGEFLQSETARLLWTPLHLESGESTRNGLGWILRELGGRPVVGHGGRSAGGTTSFLIFPQQHMVVAVATNVTGAPVGPVALGLARLFLPSGGR